MSDTPTKTQAGDFGFMLGRIDGKLDAALQRVDSHEVRISKLERFQNILIGVAAASGPTSYGLAKLFGF